ncbi:MAG: hypothetical protein IT576_01715, partial [Verrucomicrobiales bacterium]|nr:hypothetical protein [Verrucomicrobiales bacterium]
MSPPQGCVPPYCHATWHYPDEIISALNTLMKPLFNLLLLTLLPVSFSLADDAAWLQDKGTLIFHDSFDREEEGNLAKAIGNGWESATAARVP